MIMYECDAVLSGCGKYRYELSRTWSLTKPVLNIIGLNPSTANADIDDPTIRRCVGFAKEHGYGKLIMTNLFAYRSTNPKGLRDQKHPVDIENVYIRANMSVSDDVLLAWGSNATHYPLRVSEVVKMLRDKQITPLYLSFTASGQPAHPLYLKKDLRFKAFTDLHRLL